MASRSDRQRVVLGVRVSAQVVAFLLATLGLTMLAGLAVASWLESSA